MAGLIAAHSGRHENIKTAVPTVIQLRKYKNNDYKLKNADSYFSSIRHRISGYRIVGLIILIR